MSRRVLPIALFLVCAGVYGLTVSPDPSPDAFTADFAAWHIGRTGDPVPDISTFPLLDDNVIRETWIVETADGREAVGRAPGVIALAVPAYVVLRPSGISAVPGGLMAALLCAVAITLLFLLLRDRTGSRAALIAAGLVAFATPVWSVAADAMWPHTLTTLGIIGMAWAADRGRWWLVGLFGGLALWGRLHAALICAVLGVGTTWSRRRAAIAVRAGLAAGATLALMSVWTKWMYGSWDPTSGYRAGDFGDNAAGNVLNPLNYLGFLVSADRGLLWWSPLLLVLVPAAWRNRHELPDWSRWLAIGGVSYLLSQAVLNRFSGGDHFYGYRTSLELVVSLAPALALSAHRMTPRARRWFTPLAVLQVVLIAPGAVRDGFYTPVRDVWWRNAFLDALLSRPLDLLPPAGVAMLAALVVVQVLRSPRVRRFLDADAPVRVLRDDTPGGTTCLESAS
jgi:alpha-1,2-mannosyltransferase